MARKSGMGRVTWKGKDKSYHIKGEPGESWHRVVSFERLPE